MPQNLRTDQLAVLLLLYKFRYATAPLLTQKLHLKQRTSINSRLNILESHGYIGKRYDPSYKIRLQPASYHLLPPGFAALKGMEGVSPSMLKNMYKDASASDQFVEHCLSVFSINNALESVFGERFDMFSKGELHGMEGVPEVPPDGLIKLKTSASPHARGRHYLLYVAESHQPLFAINRTITTLLEYGDNGEWSGLFTKLPGVIIACDTPPLEKRLRKQARRVESEAANGQTFYTTTTTLLKGMQAPGDTILWPLRRDADDRIEFGRAS